MTVTDADCRAYLLGQMPAADAERLEVRVLADDDLFQAVQSAEDDLFDGFARGRLTPDERARFVERFGGETGRIGFARALAQRTGTKGLTRPPIWVPLAAAAAVLLAVGAGFWLRSRPAPAPPAPVVAHVAMPGAPAVVAMLTLGTSRAAGDRPVIELPAGTSTVELRVRLNPADRFDAYSMTLRSTKDTVAWQADNLHATVQAGDLVVAATAPVGNLADGVYELAVRGGGADLGFLSVRIMRKS
jgi:hypothetical protein